MPQEDEAKLYVGNIPEDATKEDIYDLFETYGRVLYVDIKNGKISRFAFVAYRDFRDADDAVNYLDKFDYHGRSLRVEHSTGVGPRGWGGQPLSSINGDNFRIARGPGGPQRRSDFRVFVEGIPQTGSWQDLKDHFRPAGEICFAMISHNKTGIVEFEKKSSVQRSIDIFDKTEFTSHHTSRKHHVPAIGHAQNPDHHPVPHRVLDHVLGHLLTNDAHPVPHPVPTPLTSRIARRADHQAVHHLQNAGHPMNHVNATANLAEGMGELFLLGVHNMC
ncbi:CBN-RSP-3 protein [Caenorhabditis brenneri]|uniref:CBN-RSP-3 protein n=1 Tax=Caenorhabditis brenneri TaxID=135651 RepID=G0MH51_CAEBE|nr:CBN-RSP-3 protein [Caenorhabditis brenneri]